MEEGASAPFSVYLMSDFSDFMASASERFLEITKEDVEIAGKGTIDAGVDSIEFAKYKQLGGRKAGVEFTIFVRITDFTKLGGTKGDKIEVRGYEATVLKAIDAGDGQYELSCGNRSLGNL